MNTAFSERFEREEIAAEDFGHREHVRAAFELLKKYDFLEATARYAKTIKSMAAKAGAPEKFNVTITVAFMGLIAEKMTRIADYPDFDSFYTMNPDLTGNALSPWYSAERISCDLSRKVFLMPDLIKNSTGLAHPE
mgnify:CR=1 FL=1|jgi:hypothetical protein